MFGSNQAYSSSFSISSFWFPSWYFVIDYTPGNVGGHHNDEELCSFNKIAAAVTALFSSTEAETTEAAAACAATRETVEFIWAADATEGTPETKDIYDYFILSWSFNFVVLDLV